MFYGVFLLSSSAAQLGSEIIDHIRQLTENENNNDDRDQYQKAKRSLQKALEIAYGGNDQDDFSDDVIL